MAPRLHGLLLLQHFLTFFGSAAGAQFNSRTVTAQGVDVSSPFLVKIDTKSVLHKTGDEFVSVALDASLIKQRWQTFNTSSVRLQTLTAALSPCYLRLGGTNADFLIFDKDGYHAIGENKAASSVAAYDDEAEVLDSFYGYPDIVGGPKNLTNFTMSGRDWMTLTHFTEAVGMLLLFDFNVLLRRDSRWDSTNAQELLRYTIERNCTEHLSFQLGNEPNAFRHAVNRSVSASHLGKDFLSLHDLLTTRKPFRQHFSRATLVGPDTTRPKHRSLEYLQRYLAVAGKALSAITWHQYYMNGRNATVDNFTDPTILDYLPGQIVAVQQAVKEAGFQDTKLWLGETSSAWGGGARHLSDRYVAGFMWLDKLGIAARSGLDVVIRQTLYDGNYALINRYLQPNPDYWLTFLYKRLVGPRVLRATVTPAEAQAASQRVRVYAHCTQTSRSGYGRGSLTIYALNLLQHEVTLSLTSDLDDKVKHMYWLTPHGHGGLTSEHVNLNGVKLELVNDSTLPKLHGKELRPRQPLILKPQSFGFIVLPGANATACQSSPAHAG